MSYGDHNTENSHIFLCRDHLKLRRLESYDEFSVELLTDMAAGVRRYVVSGKVQGVGYRYFTLRVARELKINGWVRNLPDGNVEAIASGPIARLKRFDAELRIGPPRAEVTAVAIEEVAADGKLEGFHIR